MVINKLLNSSYSPTVQLSLIKSGLYELEANSRLYASYVNKKHGTTTTTKRKLEKVTKKRN